MSNQPEFRRIDDFLYVGSTTYRLVCNSDDLKDYIMGNDGTAGTFLSVRYVQECSRMMDLRGATVKVLPAHLPVSLVHLMGALVIGSGEGRLAEVQRLREQSPADSFWIMMYPHGQCLFAGTRAEVDEVFDRLMQAIGDRLDILDVKVED